METVNTAQQPIQVVVAKSEKSIGLAVVLTAIFGPLGLFYSSIIGGFVMLAVSFVVGLITLGFGLIVTWPTCIFWAYMATKRYNAKLAADSVAM
ncbi:hypothetical protein SAMN05216582_1108 [Selenomonas ruminantium]|uniref:Uncharacterized protein n=1 Tax=Selenomonas ruminantium TaxID=971 RepID=A0A1M6TZM5_SELRU|nr:hypothetical protein [Selenomonas ruminantium]SHK62455.1 hypothetical protein SAMN05216582_1108 [Selenomonas ruminantium]